MTDHDNPVPPDEPSGTSEPSMPLVPGAAAPQTSRRRPRYLLIGAGATAILLASVAALGSLNRQSPLEAAREACGADVDRYAELGDDGDTLTLRSRGKENNGLSFAQLECYWSELEMPDSVEAEVGATRALDGRQSGEWEGIRASWSYHPDDGVQMIFTLVD